MKKESFNLGKNKLFPFYNQGIKQEILKFSQKNLVFFVSNHLLIKNWQT